MTKLSVLHMNPPRMSLTEAEALAAASGLPRHWPHQQPCGSGYWGQQTQRLVAIPDPFRWPDAWQPLRHGERLAPAGDAITDVPNTEEPSAVPLDKVMARSSSLLKLERLSPPLPLSDHEVSLAEGQEDPLYNDDTTWESNFNDLQEYKAKHGDCDVPTRYPPNPTLGWWVGNQRAFKQRDRLRGDRVARLDEIGFCWRLRSQRTPFATRCKEWVALRVNESIPRPLREWQKRTLYRMRTSRMNAQERKLLEVYGISWESLQGGTKRKVTLTSGSKDATKDEAEGQAAETEAKRHRVA